MVNVLAGEIVVSEFNLQSCYNIYFQANTLGKVCNLVIGLIILLLLFHKDNFDIK